MSESPLRDLAATPHHLIDAKELGSRLGCSWRHVLRMADRGLMPWGFKLGSLRRWDADEIKIWIAGGCKQVRLTKKRGAP